MEQTPDQKNDYYVATILKDLRSGESVGSS